MPCTVTALATIRKAIWKASQDEGFKTPQSAYTFDLNKGLTCTVHEIDEVNVYFLAEQILLALQEKGFIK